MISTVTTSQETCVVDGGGANHADASVTIVRPTVGNIGFSGQYTSFHVDSLVVIQLGR